MAKKKKVKGKWTFLISVMATTITAFFIWMSWKKLSEWLGDGWLVYAITGGLVLAFLVTGHLTTKGILKRLG